MPRDDLPLQIPASVTVCFPSVSASVPQPEPYAIEIALSSLSLPEYRGITPYPGSHLVGCSAVSDGTNSAELQTLAEQIATDWYRNRLAARDIRTAGYPTPVLDGLVDRVEVIHQPGDAGVRVLRGFQGDSGGHFSPDGEIQLSLSISGSAGSAGLPSGQPVAYSGTVWYAGASVSYGGSTVALYGATTLCGYDGSTICLHSGATFNAGSGSTVTYNQATFNLIDTVVYPTGSTAIYVGPGVTFPVEGPGTFQVTTQTATFQSATYFGGPATNFVGTPITIDPTSSVLNYAPTWFQNYVDFGDLSVIEVRPGSQWTLFNVLRFGVPPPGQPPPGLQFPPGVPADQLGLWRPPTLEPEEDPEEVLFPPEAAGDMVVHDGSVYLVDSTGAMQPVAGPASLTPEALAATLTPEAAAAIVAAGGGAGYSLVKTFTPDDLTDADTAQDVAAYSLPAKTALRGWLVVTQTAGTGPGLVGLTLQLLEDGTPLGAGTTDGLTAGSVDDQRDSLTPKPVRSWTATKALAVRFQSSGCNLDDLTGGEWRLYLDMQTLP